MLVVDCLSMEWMAQVDLAKIAELKEVRLTCMDFNDLPHGALPAAKPVGGLLQPRGFQGDLQTIQLREGGLRRKLSEGVGVLPATQSQGRSSASWPWRRSSGGPTARGDLHRREFQGVLPAAKPRVGDLHHIEYQEIHERLNRRSFMVEILEAQAPGLRQRECQGDRRRRPLVSMGLEHCDYVLENVLKKFRMACMVVGAQVPDAKGLSWWCAWRTADSKVQESIWGLGAQCLLQCFWRKGECSALWRSCSATSEGAVWWCFWWHADWLDWRRRWFSEDDDDDDDDDEA